MKNGTNSTARKVRANILDPIHDDLDQRLFKGITPRPSKIKFIKDHFMDGISKLVPNPEPYFDMYLTGSITTYQYSDGSDVDVSIFPKYDQLAGVMGIDDPNQIRKKLVTLVIDKLDGITVPGTPFPVQHFVVAPGIDPSQMYQPGVRSAWSFQTHEWLVPPEKDRAHNVQRELPLIYLRAHAIADKMRTALDTDPDAAKRMFQRIHIKRTKDQVAGRGDFSEGNIVYKYLLHEGLFDRLRDIGVYIAKVAVSPEPISDDEAIDMLKDSIIGAKGDWQKVLKFYRENAFIFPPEKWDSLMETARREFMEEQYQQQKQFNDLKEQMQQFHEGVVEYRWAWYNGHTLIQNVSDDKGGNWNKNVHYEMLEQLGVSEDDLFATEYGPPSPDNKEGLYLGYADYYDGKVDFTEGSLDYPGAEPPQVVQDDVARAIRQDQQKIAATDSDSIQVIYNFQTDRIILGSRAESLNLPNTVLIGSYDGKEVTLYEAAHQWVNTTYFKKLWYASFPDRPLLGVHLHRGGAGKFKIGALAPDDIKYVEAFMYVGEPFNELYDTGASMHYEYVEDFIREHNLDGTDELEKYPMLLGHIGEIVERPQSILSPYSQGVKETGQFICKFDSHTMGYLRTDPTIADRAIGALRTIYPNIIDITNQGVSDRWWKSTSSPDAGFEDWECPECGASGPDEVYEDPEGGFECHHCGMPIVSKVADVFDQENPDHMRGQIYYGQAFYYLGYPQNELLWGGSEHGDLLEEWIAKLAERYEYQGYATTPQEAWEMATHELERTPAIGGHVGQEYVADNGGKHIQYWAVFYSGARGNAQNETLKIEALRKLNQVYAGKGSVKEADDYVKNQDWYGYGG